jgi:hypothetical protein
MKQKEEQEHIIVRDRIAHTTQPTKVLAFTPTFGRPLMLRHCVFQMQTQTYPVDQAIFINAPDADSALNYLPLISSIPINPLSKIVAKFSTSKSPYLNYISALNLVDLDNYDLFIKIDDDDIYAPSYVESCWQSFKERAWDFSGSHSHGYIENDKFYPNSLVKSLGLNSDDISLGVQEFMPPTMAFSRRAIEYIVAMEEDGINCEDVQWRKLLYGISTLKKHIRDDKDFIYNRHVRGVSNPNRNK